MLKYQQEIKRLLIGIYVVAIVKLGLSNDQCLDCVQTGYVMDYAEVDYNGYMSATMPCGPMPCSACKRGKSIQVVFYWKTTLRKVRTWIKQLGVSDLDEDSIPF